MKCLGHHSHLVNLIGCVTDLKQPMIVLELCSKGDLQRHLATIRETSGEVTLIKFEISVLRIYEKLTAPDEKTRLKSLISFAWQINDAMVML